MHHVSAAAFMGLCEIVVQDGLHGEDMRRTGHKRMPADLSITTIIRLRKPVSDANFSVRSSVTLTDFYLHTWPERMVKFNDNGSVYFDAAAA